MVADNVRQAFLTVAQAQKSWADKTNTDDKWKRNASTMSLDMLQNYLEKSADELTDHMIRHWQSAATRTHAAHGFGPQTTSDPHAKRLWEALEQGDTGPLFKHYKCFL